jgi:general secretion pathway protein G
MKKRNRNRREFPSQGFTLIELILTVTVIAVLVGLAVPLTRNTLQREREVELRQALRDLRTAIDKYKAASDQGLIEPPKLGTEGYPENLEILVEGVPMTNAVDRKLKFLRKVPIDPMTNTTDWGLRSYQDEPDSPSFGGENVFDVYTKSEGTALDGTKYKDW